MFPQLLQSTDGRIADFYKVKQEGSDRVAGVEADIVLLVPKDSMRFGYRVWTEQKKGLVVKLQTLDTDGKVLEQAAFSELQLDAPVKMDKLLQMMGKVEGYRVGKTGPGEDHRERRRLGAEGAGGGLQAHELLQAAGDGQPGARRGTLAMDFFRRPGFGVHLCGALRPAAP